MSRRLHSPLAARHALDYDTEAKPEGRILGARKLLLTAAVIMSIYLVLSSIVAALLIHPDEFEVAVTEAQMR